MRIGYADPPYPGLAHYYRGHPDYAGEVDHADLIARLECEFDGWVLHTNATRETITLLAPMLPEGARWMAWVKSFAAFRSNVPVAYAWEPVIVKAARKPVVTGRIVMRDWVRAPITLQRGFIGAKPDAVCRWAFEVVGAEPDDELVDLFPGSGAVSRAWAEWRRELRLPV
jgi:hypothetical protein